jgi:hypothetical protein
MPKPYEIHETYYMFHIKEGLIQEWQEFVIVAVYKMEDKTN